MHYERVRSDLQQAERTISMALRSNIVSETERERWRKRSIWYRRQRKNAAWRRLSPSGKYFHRE